MAVCVEYAERTLLQLIADIVEGNLEASWEVHRMPLFELADGRHVTLAEYVDVLRKSAHEGRWFRDAGTEIVDRACDLLLDRFRNIPDEESDADGSGESDAEGHDGESRGPDCRKYFGAFLKYATEVLKSSPAHTDLQAEVLIAHLLQKFVRRHLYFCMRESLRTANPLTSRYAAKVNGRTIVLWFPRKVSGSERRHWLEKHIPGFCSGCPPPRNKIQAAINKYFGVQRLVSLNEKDLLSRVSSHAVLHGAQHDEGISGKCTRELIAAEKARTIDQQMRPIRALGCERLGDLVRTILENIETEQETDKAIAVRFGLSLPTFSRFGGRGGHGKRRRKRHAALFVNIAHYMAHIPRFMEIAEDEGVLAKAKRCAPAGVSPQTERIPHES